MSEQLYRRSDEALFSSVGDDIVALHVENGHCYGMEKVTADVWELLARPIGLSDICERLIGMYDVEPEQCRAEVQRLLDQLCSEGLVETSADD